MKRAIILGACLLALSACGSDDSGGASGDGGLSFGGSSKAEDICEEVQKPGVRVIDALTTMGDAIESGDVTAAELRAECGDIVDAVLNQMGDGPLNDQVEVELGTCGSDEINGSLVNNSDQVVDVTLRYELLESDGVTRVGDGLVFVDAVRPGQTVKWDDFLFEEDYKKCRVEIDSVRPT